MTFGDVNGDGLADLVLACPQGGSFGQGEILVVFGHTAANRVLHLWSGEAPAASIEGKAGGSLFGSWVLAPGDLDGDAFADIVTAGRIREDPIVDETYILFGRDAWPEVAEIYQELAQRTALARLSFGGGYARLAGDLDHDGFADFWMTAEERSTPQVAAFFGDSLRARFPEPAGYVFDLNGDSGFGDTASGLGDVNGDRWSDVVVGANALVRPMSAWIVLGSPDGFRETATLPELSAEGRVLRIRDTPADSSKIGYTVGAAGDFDGDGLADAIVVDKMGGRDFEGVAYVLFGSQDWGRKVNEVEVRESPARKLSLRGAYAYDEMGFAAGLGDVNGDGFSDLAAWTVRTGFERDPDAYSRGNMVLGTASPPGEILLRELSGYDGFSVTVLGGAGEVRSMAGGDFDGDGVDDVALRVILGSEDAVIVLFGKKTDAPFIRGDANMDGKVDISDAIATLGYLFLGGLERICLDAADANDDGEVNISDPIYLLEHLFLGGKPPPPPYPEAGLDPTADELDCRAAGPRG